MLDALVAEQKRLDLTDKEFAALLGLYRTTWNRIRHGAYPMPPRVVQNAVRMFPELEESASLFLFPKVNEVTASAHKSRRRKEPSNIDAKASEATRTLVLTGDRQTLACRGTETAPTGQGQGGSLSALGVPRTARKVYVTPCADASDLTSRAVSRVDLDGEWKGVS